MDGLPLPPTLVGAAVFFGLLGMLAWLLIRETLRLVLRPALVIAALLLIAIWAGVLDQTVVGGWLSWTGEQLIAGVSAASQWAASAWESAGGGASGGA
jgi:hypothetical protein